ncbi:helix-turn-helix transcriptional regulator [Ahniella affigens]|nr:LuxR C-terminal-related transcriptional regulator [Ahniella affigens]
MPWSEAETRAMLRVAHRRWYFYALLVVLLMVSIWIGVSGMWMQMPLGARALAIGVAGFWVVVLWQKLRFARDVLADQHRMPNEHVGPVHLLPRQRVGWFAPMSYELCSGSIRASVGSVLPVLDSTTGLYRIRIGAVSRFLVSIAPCIDAPDPKPAPTAPAPSLSPREQALLDLLARGLSDKQIARELGLTPATVRTYNSNLFKKLGIADRDAAATWAARQSGDANLAGRDTTAGPVSNSS